MQAILLCAGFGTRLKPLTEHLPKPAIPFLGHPMVWYAMQAIKQAGLTNFAANVHYLPEQMAACLNHCAQDFGFQPPAIFRENEEILGTGGGARSCLDLLPEDDCYLIYHGDVICAADIQKAYTEHKASGADVTLIVAPRPPESNLGMIGIDERQQVVQIRDWCAADLYPHAKLTPACFTGIHIVNRNILKHIPNNQYVCLVTEIYKNMLEKAQPIHAVMTDAFFADIGTPGTYIEAMRTLCQNKTLLPNIQCADFETQNLEDWEFLCHTILDRLPQQAHFSR